MMKVWGFLTFLKLADFIVCQVEKVEFCEGAETDRWLYSVEGKCHEPDIDEVFQTIRLFNEILTQ